MAKRKVPSQASSGRETFNDNLIGNQITDGSSQLTATNFSLDNTIPERDTKQFRSVPFSEFLTIEDLKEETDGPKSKSKRSVKKEGKVKFRQNKEAGSKTLFGSLSKRLSSSVKNIIDQFPAGFFIDKDTPVSFSQYTAESISYDTKARTTTLKFEKSKIFNPLDIIIDKPLSNVQPEVSNSFRNFFDSYSKYSLVIDGVDYPILSYTQAGVDGLIKIKVKGKPFNGVTYSESFLIRPIEEVVEEFFESLDDLEKLILDRESTPKYTAEFKLPQDSLDGSKTETTTTRITWPLFKDGWNIKIGGTDYVTYLEKLKSIGDEVDQYKSNLIARFLTTASLNEFDTQDQRMSSMFQIYGSGFDSVKKFIDNIAYMRNVSYDKINNIPDVLLKNLSNTLGLDSVNLFDEKSLDQTLYSRIDSQFEGINLGLNMVEAEAEFYRRLVINLVRIYKSKGTRKSIEFFLRFIGAPEPLIKINEHVYEYEDVRKTSEDIDSDIYDLTQNTKTFTIGEIDSSTFNYSGITTTGSTTYQMGEYPIVLTGSTRYGDVQKIVSEGNDVFFQKGAGWYEITLQHRSSTELDVENSNLLSNPKVIKTKNKNFTYGEDYFDLYRQFYGLDYGHELHNTIDNDKVELLTDTDSKKLNRKNIQIYLSSAQGIDYDVYRQSRDLEVTFGLKTLSPQTGFTFAEYMDNLLNEQIRNSHIVKYQKSYIQLEDVYWGYLDKVGTPYSFPTVNEFINKMSPHWVEIIEQFVPATTLWTGGNILENSRIGRSKHDYEKPCMIEQVEDNLYPKLGFEHSIEEDLEVYYLGDKDLFRGLTVVSGVTYVLKIVLMGDIYTASSPITLTGGNLFDPFVSTSECTTINDVVFSGGEKFDGSIHLPLICDFKCNLNPDRDVLNPLWISAVDSIFNQINEKYFTKTSYTGYDTISNHAGGESYERITGNTQTTDENQTIEDGFNTELSTNGENYGYENVPIVSHEFYTDSDGVEKIRIIPFTYDTQLYVINPEYPYNGDQYIPADLDCLDLSTFDFYWESTYLTGTTQCDPKVDVYGPGTFYTLPEDSDDCILMEDVYFEVSGVTFGNEDTVDDGDPCTDCPPYNTSWPLNIFIDCIGGYNEDISGHTYTVDHVSGCTFVIYNVRENDVIDISITDAANCDQKVRIEGLQQKFEWDPVDGDDVTTSRSHYLQYSFESYADGDDPINSSPLESQSGITFCDNYSGYTLQPIVQYRPTFDYGLRQNTKVIKVNNGVVLDGNTTWDQIQTYFDDNTLEKINIENVVIGDRLLSGVYKDCPFSTQDYRDAVISGYSFSYDYKVVTVENKDCLGSTKINKINERFSFLPNTRLWVMTKTMEDGTQGENWRFTEKYPEELYPRPEDPTDPCCTYQVGYYESGDFIFNEHGFPIEVLKVDLDYCARDLFYHLNVSPTSVYDIPTNCSEVILFNGDSEDCVLVGHDEQKFENLDMKMQQYFQDRLDCSDMPDIDELERDLTGLEDCDNINVFKLKHYTSGEIKYGKLDPAFSIGDIVTVITHVPLGASVQRLSPGKDCWEIIAKTYQPNIDYDLVEICTDLLTPTPSPTTSPTPTPTPSPSPTATPTPTISPTPTSTPTPTPTGTPTPTPTSTPTATPTSTPTPTPTGTPTPTPTSTPTPTPTSTPTPTPTPNCDFDVDTNIVTPTPTPTPNCDFDIDIDVVTPTPTPTPSPTPNCDFDVDIDVVTPTPTPTPSPTPNCDFDIDVDVVTPTPTPTTSPTPTPTATPNCDFDVDVDVVTPTPTPSPTGTPTPTPTPNCDFDIDVDVVTPTPTPSPTSTATPTPTPDCDFDIDVDVVTPTPTPSPTSSPTPTPTPNCDFDIDVDVVTPTPTPTTSPTATPTNTPTPTPTPNCDFDIDVDVVTPTPTPSPSPTSTPTNTPTNTPTPSPTPNCDFDIDVDVVTPTPTPTSTPTATPTNTPTPSPTSTPTATPTNTPTPSPTPNCDFDVDVDVVTPTPTPSPSPTNTPTPSPTSSPTPSPTASPTSTPTPTPTPNCDFDVDVDVVTPTPTPSPTSSPTPSPTATPTNTPTPSPTTSPTATPTPSPSPTATPTPTPTPTGIDCPIPCTTTINSDLFISTNSDLSGVNIKDLGGYCNEVRVDGNVVSTNGEEWYYDINTCLVYGRTYNDPNGTTCIGEYVNPVGTEVNSFVHTDGTLTPTQVGNKIFDTDIRFIDNNNNAIVIITEWNSTLTSLLHVHILCDCSFEGSANETVIDPV